MEKHRRAHRWAFPLGVLLTALAVVGAATLVRWCVGYIRQEVENPKEKLAYEEFLKKIVVRDPEPFESVGTVLAGSGSVPQLLDICIWSILDRDETTPVSFPVDDETGDMLIDQEKVAAEFEKIFGEPLPPTSHASVEGSYFDFVYDAEAKLYRVPTTAALSIYSPRIKPGGIKKTGGAIELTVEYLANNDFEFDEYGRPSVPPVAAKTMLITLYAQADEDYPYRVGSILQPTGENYVGGAPKLG